MTVCVQCSSPLPQAARECPSCGTPARGVPVGDEVLAQVRAALAPEYEVLREVGRGGMGVVYLAREVALQREVALKVLPPQYSGDPVLAQRFLQEARTAARLDHPHIVPIHQVIERGGFSLFAMKFVAGASLHAQLRSRGALGFDEVRQVLRSSAEALAYAHRIGVVHRDVKPANILVDDRDWVYVMDFGIAKAIAEDTPSSRTGAVMGTPHYLAPELCRGGRADALTDQYALAIVGYQLLCGRLPFEGDTMEALLAQRLFGDPPPLRRYRPDVPADLEFAVERAMRRDRASRFPSLLEMAEFLGGGAVTPKPRWRWRSPIGLEETPTLQLTMRGRVRRALRAGAITAAAVAITAAGSLWAVTRPAPAERLWPSPAREGPLTGPELPVDGAAAGTGQRSPPAATVERIGYHLQEGRVWFEIGRYQDALEQYWRGIAAVAEVTNRFSTSDAIDSLRIALQKAIEEAELACARTANQTCRDPGD